MKELVRSEFSYLSPNIATAYPARCRSPSPITLNTEIRQAMNPIKPVELPASLATLVTPDNPILLPTLQLKLDHRLALSFPEIIVSPASSLPSLVATVNRPPTSTPLADLATRFVSLPNKTEPRLSELPVGLAAALAFSETISVRGETTNWYPRLEGARTRRRTRSLQEIAASLHQIRDRVGEQATATREALKELVSEVQKELQSALVPMSGLAPAGVLTRTRGVRIRREKHPEERLWAVELDQHWMESREVSLTALTSAVVRDGQLSLSVAIDDISWAGRIADLILISEGMEVVLAQARINPPDAGKNRCKVSFSVDLKGAGVQLQDGAIPFHRLRIVVEPSEGHV